MQSLLLSYVSQVQRPSVRLGRRRSCPPSGGWPKGWRKKDERPVELVALRKVLVGALRAADRNRTLRDTP